MQHKRPVCGRGLAWRLWQCPLAPAPAGSAALLNIRSVASRGNAHRLQHLEAAQRSTTPKGCATPVQLIGNSNTLKLATQGPPAPLQRGHSSATAWTSWVQQMPSGWGHLLMADEDTSRILHRSLPPLLQRCNAVTQPPWAAEHPGTVRTRSGSSSASAAGTP